LLLLALRWCCSRLWLRSLRNLFAYYLSNQMRANITSAINSSKFRVEELSLAQ
jgi:hypothetical protein